MIISPDSLRKDVVQLINQINTQIDQVTKASFAMNCEPYELRDTSGNWALTPLLLAKTQAYAILVQLQAKK